MLGFEPIQTPSALRSNQLTGGDTATVIFTTPETEVPEDGAITSGNATTVLLLKLKPTTIALIIASKPVRKVLLVCVFNFNRQQRVSMG